MIRTMHAMLLEQRYALAAKIALQGNSDKLEQALVDHALDECRRYERELLTLGLSDQEIINAANSLLNPEIGIVAGDGCYYPRYAPDGSDPFNP